MRFELALAAMVILGASVSGRPRPPFPQNLSERAVKVLGVARHEAGRRGAPAIAVNDLIVGLIIEDQDPDVKILVQGLPPGVNPPKRLGKERDSFFPATVATNVLAALNEIPPRADSVPHTAEISISPELIRVLNAAARLPSELHQREVQVYGRRVQAVVPLDLLAAALREPCEGTQMLQEAGITEGKVLQTIRAGGDLEKGTPPPTP